MKFTIDLSNATLMSDGTLGMIIYIPKHYQKDYDDLIKLSESEGKKDFELKKHSEKRSLSANAGLWLMCDRIAKKLQTSKDDIYVQSLKRYGVFETVIVKKEAFESLEKRVNESSSSESKLSLCRITDEWSKKGDIWVEVECYFGSSTYTSEEFKPLLEGVISEAEELGIPFFSKQELASMLESWSRRKDEATM